MKIVIGVDPGVSGAIAFYDADSKKLVRVEDMPLARNVMPLAATQVHETRSKRAASGKRNAASNRNRREVDPYQLGLLIDGLSRDVAFAVVEEVGGMVYTDAKGQVRGQGTVSSFNFGKADGIVIGVLATCLIPMHFVRPGVWKALMNLSSEKDKSRELATKLFTGSAHLWQRKKDDGGAEASLLAYFGATRFTG